MSIQHVKRSDIQAPATNHDPAKKLRKNTCLKCNKHHDTLHCTNPGCPIVIHKHCMPCTARFDDGGNFLCPYCVYKRSVDECRKTKELVILAKQNLSNFMDAKIVKPIEDFMGSDVPMKPDGIRSQNFDRGIRRVPLLNNDISDVVDVNLKNDDLSAEIRKNQKKSNDACFEENGEIRSGSSDQGIRRAPQSKNDIPSVVDDEHTNSEQLEVNLKNDDLSGEIRKNQKKSDEKKTPLESTVPAEEVNLASANQQKKNAMDKNDDRLSQEVENVEVSNIEGKVNDRVSADENISRIHKAVSENNTDETSEVGDIQKADEQGKQVKLQKNDVILTRKRKTEVSYEEFDTEDESRSSQGSYQKGYSLRCKRKREISVDSDSSDESKNTSVDSDSSDESKKTSVDSDSSDESKKASVDSDSSDESKKASGSSESEFEEYEEVTHVKKSRWKISHSKQLEQTPISIGRRKKLPWTEEEEDILKEAVDKISLTVKKNMPWTKILEYGSHIFDGTRTPNDLKDKWRRIVNKAHETA